MRDEKIRSLIQVAKTLKTKQENQTITDFEEEELKEIYRVLTINGTDKQENSGN